MDKMAPVAADVFKNSLRLILFFIIIISFSDHFRFDAIHLRDIFRLKKNLR